MTAIAVTAPDIKVNGQALPAIERDAVTEMRIERALGLVGRANFRFHDEGFAIAASQRFALGATVEVTVRGEQIFDGIVTGVSLDQSGGELPQLTVVVDDPVVKLSQGTTLRNHANSTATDAIRKVTSEAGLVLDMDSTPGVQKYLLEAGTGLAFLNRLAERSGLVWWYDERKLHVKKSSTSTATVTATLGDDLIEFSVRASGLRPVEVGVTGWDPDKGTAVTGKYTPSAASGSQFVADYLGAKPQKLVKAKRNTADWSPQTQSEADAIAQSLYDESASGAVVARGTMFINTKVKPATTMTVKNAGPASGNYRVTEVQHIYNARGFTTRFVAGSNRPSGLVDTLGRDEPDVSFNLSGLIPAIVTNNKNSEAPGTVKVKFVHAPMTDGKELESAWARIVTLGGGANRGMVFMPEVNDEVLVGFENSDPRRPVVLGGLFSQKSGMPAAKTLVAGDGKVELRQITSRTGHVVEISDADSDAKSHVLLKLAGGQQSIRIGKDRMDLKMPSGKPFAITVGSASIEISGEGDITIKGKKISLQATDAVTVDGMSKAEVTSKGQVNVQGTTVAVKAQATANLEASGPVAIKGALVAIN